MSTFDEVLFSEEISYGSVSGTGFQTNIIVLDSGQEERVSRRSQAQHRYDISFGIKDYEALTEVKNFYLARGGASNGFRFKDWADFHSNPTDASFRNVPGARDQSTSPASGDGSNKFFQIVKTYESGLSQYVRTIKKPIAATVRVWVNGSEVLSGWTVDDTTGIIEFTSAPANGHSVEASFEFHVPVRFDATADEFFAASMQNWGHGGIDSILLVEILDPDPSGPIDVNYGGATEIATASNVTMSIGSGRLWVVSTTTGGLSVTLPNPTGIPTGRHIFTVINSGSNSFTLKDHAATTLATLAAAQGVDVHLTQNSGGTKIWYAL